MAVSQADLAAYCDSSVNLKREDARVYRDQVNRLRDKLARHIAEHPDYGLVKMLLSGSLAKGTALRTINDADVALYVQSDKAPTDEGDLVAWIIKRLREAYPQMDPEQFQPGNHGVCISFRGTGLDVDVVPVYYSGDADDRGELISRDSGARILTSIPLHLEFIRKRKETHPTHLVQVIRLLKWWVRERKKADSSFRLKSFLVELIVAKLSDDGHTFGDYASALEAFFSYVVKTGLKGRIAFSDYYPLSELPESGEAMQIFDPVNSKNNVARGYSSTDRGKIVDAASDAFDALAEARFATTAGRAVECWRIVLGPSFRV